MESNFSKRTLIKPRYRPSIERLKEEYSRQIARKLLLKRLGNPPLSRIPDNSEPWFAEWPPSLETLQKTNEEIRKLIRHYRPHS